MFGFGDMFSRSSGASEEAFRNVLESLALFAHAPAVARGCVYAVVLSTREADLQEFRAAFEHSDRDGDGVVSRNDLGSALSWASALSMVDPHQLFSAADVDSSGFLDFRKFAAACLYGRMAPLDEWLAEQAFVSLDQDYDGLLSTRDVFTTFGFLPTGLPTHRWFSTEEWTRCILAAVRAEEARSAPKKTVTIDAANQNETESCGVGGLINGGILSGCLNKRSHKRQGSHFESLEDIENIIDVEVAMSRYSPTLADSTPLSHRGFNCRQEEAAMNHYKMYPSGVGLSSPTYVPMPMSSRA